ncbi:MAG: transcriptional repressor [Lachnospiraceae bacterium]|nr:transcriptional repressor [Lachnospiraceae bacterium]
MTVRHSRQRECIKSFLMTRKDHPTADVVYAHVREQFPNISLGTVYRNLSLLSDLGEIQRINVGDGVEHFDVDTSTHYHIVCTKCGCVQDIRMAAPRLLEQANSNYEGVVTGQTILFTGTCPDCLKTAQPS